jgi:uncharacterized protein
MPGVWKVSSHPVIHQQVVKPPKADKVRSSGRNGLSVLILLAPGFALGGEPIDQPAFDCGKVEAGSIEQMVCEDEELAQLDRKLAEVYTAAQGANSDAKPADLRAEQRGWLKGRDDCWKAVDTRLCVATQYRLRLAELQARYRLVEGIGPIHYQCDGEDSHPLIVHYFHTDPPTAWAAYGDASAILYRQPSGSGARYEGRNIALWEHHGEATLVWGYGAKELQCRVVRGETQTE